MLRNQPPLSPSVQVVTSGGKSQYLVRWATSCMNQPASIPASWASDSSRSRTTTMISSPPNRAMCGR